MSVFKKPAVVAATIAAVGAIIVSFINRNREKPNTEAAAIGVVAGRDVNPTHNYHTEDFSTKVYGDLNPTTINAPWTQQTYTQNSYQHQRTVINFISAIRSSFSNIEPLIALQPGQFGEAETAAQTIKTFERHYRLAEQRAAPLPILESGRNFIGAVFVTAEEAIASARTNAVRVGFYNVKRGHNSIDLRVFGEGHGIIFTLTLDEDKSVAWSKRPVVGGDRIELPENWRGLTWVLVHTFAVYGSIHRGGAPCFARKQPRTSWILACGLFEFRNTTSASCCSSILRRHNESCLLAHPSFELFDAFNVSPSS
jgi:hypothetical protein